MSNNAVIGQHDQITLPREMLRSLGLKPNDLVSISLNGTQIILEPVKKWSIESVAGSVPATGQETLDFEEMIREAKEERAEQLVKKLQTK